jgi:hypothetical protein
VSLISAGFY